MIFLNKYTKWNIDIAESTLRNWGSKLLRTSGVVKDRVTQTYWKTYYKNGVKHQEILVDGKECAEWQNYWQRFMELKKAGTLDIGTQVFKELGYCVYSCASYLFNPWSDKDTFLEVIEIVTEYLAESTSTLE